MAQWASTPGCIPRKGRTRLGSRRIEQEEHTWEPRPGGDSRGSGIILWLVPTLEPGSGKQAAEAGGRARGDEDGEGGRQDRPEGRNRRPLGRTRVGALPLSPAPRCRPSPNSLRSGPPPHSCFPIDPFLDLFIASALPHWTGTSLRTGDTCFIPASLAIRQRGTHARSRPCRRHLALPPGR